MVFQCVNIRQVCWEVLKTAALGLSFQHLPWDLANANACKTMFDPYIERDIKQQIIIIISSFGASGRLCLVIVAFLGYLHL